MTDSGIPLELAMASCTDSENESYHPVDQETGVVVIYSGQPGADMGDPGQPPTVIYH